MPEITRIPAGLLRLPEYQKSRFRKEQAAGYAMNWRDDRVGVLLANEREPGTYYCVDGNHRAAGARMKFGPDHLVLVELQRGLTLQQEFDLYIAKAESTRRVSAFDKFDGYLVSGRSTEVTIDKAVGEAGFKIQRDGKRNGISAVVVLYRLYGHIPGIPGASLHLMERTLAAAAEIWGPAGGGNNGAILYGLGTVFGNRPESNDNRVARKVREYGSLRKFLGDAKGMLGGAATGTQVARAIIAVNNDHLRDTSSNWINPL